MKSLIPVLALVTVYRTGNAQRFTSGHCPDVGVKTDFNLDAYMGKWWQWGSHGTELFQGMGKCVKAEYYHNPLTGLVNVVNSQQPIGRYSKAVIVGRLFYQNPLKKEGKFFVQFPIPVVGTVTAPLWVIGTDYVSWSVAYACLDFWFFHVKAVWVLVRDKEVNENIVNEFKPYIEKAQLTIDDIKQTDRTNCQELLSAVNKKKYIPVDV